MKALLAFLLVLTTGAFTQAPDTSKSLPRSTPEKQGIASSDVLSFIEAADKIDEMHSFMLVRHGKVVAEAWWGPFNAETPHVLYSLSKSFTSTAVGMAVAEGRLSVSDPVLKFFPEDAPANPSANLQSMRVADLLRMNAGHSEEVRLGANDVWTKAFLAHPVPFKPGTRFLYNTPATYMLSAIVQKVTGQTTLDYLRPRLFEPLGIENPTWDTSPQGISLGGYGLSVRTEDIARFGQLYLQKGTWGSRQLLPETWVEAATARQTSNGSNPNSDWDQGYGYQFWRCRNNAYRGDGAFGQYCIVLPEQDAVIAITSSVRDMQATLDLIWEKLLPAMRPVAIPEDPAAQQKLVARMKGLTIKPVEGRATSTVASRVSGKWYTFPTNEQGIQAVQFDFKSPALVVRTAKGENRIPIGFGKWAQARTTFANGLEGYWLSPQERAVAASGAWTADNVYAVRLSLYETPYTTRMDFKFDGDRVTLDTEHHVSFGPTKLPTLTGRLTVGG